MSQLKCHPKHLLNRRLTALLVNRLSNRWLRCREPPASGSTIRLRCNRRSWRRRQLSCPSETISRSTSAPQPPTHPQSTSSRCSRHQNSISSFLRSCQSRNPSLLPLQAAALVLTAVSESSASLTRPTSTTLTTKTASISTNSATTTATGTVTPIWRICLC